MGCKFVLNEQSTWAPSSEGGMGEGGSVVFRMDDRGGVALPAAHAGYSGRCWDAGEKGLGESQGSCLQ